MQNAVVAAGNFIDGRAVSGSGAIRSTAAAGTYEVAAANASLRVSTPLGLAVDIQFLTKNLWAPAP